MTETQQTPTTQSPHGPKRRRNRPFLVGVGLVLVGGLVWFYIGGISSIPPGGQDERTLMAQTQAEKSSPASVPDAPKIAENPADQLKNELEQVLLGIKEANQKKDLSRLLSFYSPNFPQLAQRAQMISKTWKIYNYPKMEFELLEINSKAANTVIARVAWTVEAQNINSQKNKNFSKVYRVTFVKESNQWRIKGLEG